jgi:hypothetical protein
MHTTYDLHDMRRDIAGGITRLAEYPPEARSAYSSWRLRDYLRRQRDEDRQQKEMSNATQ